MIENLLDLTIATQAVLRFAVRTEPLQARLPAPWQVSPDPAGVSKGANLAVTFNDALLNQDAAGIPTADAVSRYIGFAVPARHPETEEEAGFNFRILTAHPRAVPGKYKTSRLGTVLREFYAKGNDMSATVTDHFRFRDPGGGSVELQLQYRRGLPVRVVSQGNVRSATDPSILRIYKIHELLDIVRSVPQNIDRVMSYQFRNTISEFSDLFDGTERLVSVTIVPWYVRQVYGPGAT
ncbi:MAG: hypothetical protein E6H01_11080 [Bacillati bacterium ANGP1]|uniref:Uncharacterized protein n=1 Tax=Candidatus Segetimicrobium genomatis TaxID=2569760 RepID=A0A537KUB4_9BACT|nr:MAG: hypothetical protein E6H01_11080 [Terrabacteria group bacterium ANGP1]